MIESGSARLGMIVAERFRRKRKITRITRAMVSTRVNFTSDTDRTYCISAVKEGVEFNCTGQLTAEVGDLVLDPVDHLDSVCSWLPLNGQNNGPCRLASCVEPGSDLVIFHAVRYLGDVLQPYRRIVTVGNDHRPEGRSIIELAGRLDSEGLPVTLEITGREVHI